MNDVRKMIWGTIALFFVVVFLFLSIIYVSACGLTLSCRQAQPKFIGTPIPTLIPASHSEVPMSAGMPVPFARCQVSATELVGAWVGAGSPEMDAFPFTDVNGISCEGTFAEDIQPLFVENSLWYPGAIGCVSCHNAALTDRSAGLDMTSYESLSKGSGRADENATGTDVLGSKRDDSALYQILASQGFAPAGHSADAAPVSPVIFAGYVMEQVVEATPTP